MLIVFGGDLYQWDTGRFFQIIPKSNTEICAVHFSTNSMPVALVVEPHVNPDGSLYCMLPDLLLQQGETILGYEVSRNLNDGTETISVQSFPVIKRNRPQDYVYTEDDIKRWDDLIDEVRSEFDRMANEELMPQLEEAYNEELTQAKAELEQLALSSETAAKEAQASAAESSDNVKKIEKHAASCAKSAAVAEASAKTAAECAQAMAGTFDFTGYLRYQIVNDEPEQYDKGVLYIVQST